MADIVSPKPADVPYNIQLWDRLVTEVAAQIVGHAHAPEHLPTSVSDQSVHDVVLISYQFADAVMNERQRRIDEAGDPANPWVPMVKST